MTRKPMQNAPLLTPPELEARLDELYAAIDQFNRRWYFESHETLEDLWMVTPLPERTFLQGIIQLAAAFVHFARGEYPGIFKLLDASAEKLREFSPEQFGIQVAPLLTDIERIRRELNDLGPEHFRQWDEAGAPKIVVSR